VLGAAAVVATLVAIAANRAGDRDSTAASGVAAAPTTTVGDSAASTVAAAATTAAAGATTVASASSGSTTVDAAQTRGGAETVAGVLPLGAVDDADGLRVALAAAPAPALSQSTASGADGPCTVPGARLVATVVWQGTPALVFVDGANVALLVDQSTCMSVGSVPLS
jgi:hypothetical protein